MNLRGPACHDCKYSLLCLQVLADETATCAVCVWRCQDSGATMRITLLKIHLAAEEEQLL